MAKVDPNNEIERTPPPNKNQLSRITLNAYDQTFIIDLLEKYSKTMVSSNRRQIDKGFADLSLKITKELAETVTFQNQKINDFIDQQIEDTKYIRNEVTYIKSDIGHIKDRQVLFESRQVSNSNRLDSVEDFMKLPLDFDKRIHGMEVRILWLFGCVALFDTLLSIVLFWMHAKGWL